MQWLQNPLSWCSRNFVHQLEVSNCTGVCMTVLIRMWRQNQVYLVVLWANLQLFRPTQSSSLAINKSLSMLI
jgi:hypothetical protein